MTFNAENFKRVLDHISSNPEEYDQASWENPSIPSMSCGTTRCFMGWAQYFYKGRVTCSDPDVMREECCEWLGIDQEEFRMLACPFTTPFDIVEFYQSRTNYGIPVDDGVLL